MMNLLSIEEEASACRARCADMQIGDICLHVHHEIFAEPLTEPIENRIRYILEYKPTAEQALRLRMMGPPIIDDQVQADEAYAAYQKASVELQKAEAALNKAYAESQKASAALRKSYAELRKSSAELQKAYAELQKAEAESEKASAVWQKAYKLHYARLYPESPWDGRTIFAGPFAHLGRI